jgi:hypothetical protein
MSNEIGDLGEAIFNVEISRDYLFRPRHLGEKWPASDFYVELIDKKEHFFFIVQVKSTTLGIDRNRNLKVKVKKKKLQELNRYYCPTYVAGVDVNSDSVYLISLNKSKRKNLCGLPTRFKLNPQNRIALYNDVKDFWESSDLKAHKRTFNHAL